MCHFADLCRFADCHCVRVILFIVVTFVILLTAVIRHFVDSLCHFVHYHDACHFLTAVLHHFVDCSYVCHLDDYTNVECY